MVTAYFNISDISMQDDSVKMLISELSCCCHFKFLKLSVSSSELSALRNFQLQLWLWSEVN